MTVLRKFIDGTRDRLWTLGPRRSGALVAGSISATVALVPAAVFIAVGQRTSAFVFLAWFAPAIPITALLGGPLALWAISSRSVHRPALVTAFTSIIASSPGVTLAIAAVEWLGSSNHSPIDVTALIAWPILSVIGTLLLGWVFLSITIPCGYLWAAILRAVFRGRLRALSPQLFAETPGTI